MLRVDGFTATLLIKVKSQGCWMCTRQILHNLSQRQVRN